MKDMILWIGLGVLALIVLLQRFILLKQKSVQMSLQTHEDDGVYLFTSATCAVCAQMKKIHAHPIANGKILVRDVIESSELARQYKVMTVPTTLVMRSGGVVQAWHRIVTQGELAPWLK